MKRGFRLGTRLIALAGAGALAAAAVFFWSGLRSVEALFTENHKLQEALARLQEESVVSYLWLVSRDVTEEGPETTFVWMEPSAGDSFSGARVDTFTVSGETVYLDGFLVRFPGKLVADGRARALFLWRRAFGDDQAPNIGVSLDDGRGAPPRYEAIFSGALTPAQSQQFWDSLWNLAHEPRALESLGIEAISGQALAIRPRSNFLYTVRLSATGTLTAQPTRLDPASLPGS